MVQLDLKKVTENKVYRVDLGRLPGSCPGGVGSIPAFVNRDSLKVSKYEGGGTILTQDMSAFHNQATNNYFSLQDYRSFFPFLLYFSIYLAYLLVAACNIWAQNQAHTPLHSFFFRGSPTRV